MLWRKGRRSDNVIDARGEGGAGGGGGMRIGGKGLSLGGVAIVVVVGLLMGQDPMQILGSLLGQMDSPAPATQQQAGGRAPAANDEQSEFVRSILGDTEDPATFYPGSKHILFTIGDATLVCRILEGEFLDWRRVLPQNNPVKLVGNVSRLTDSIERVGLVISEKLKSPVRCKFGDNSAEFRTISTIGEAYDVCPIAGDGKDLEIGFNCKYLLDALRAVPDSECTLEMINGLSPIVLNPTEGNRYSYMVLPVRLKAGE